ncbi:glycosyltransferase family 4 protein [bacterium]|nr:glycosyltransferase family 4 protein [bacterium]
MQHDFAIGSYCSSRSWGGLEMNVLRFLKWMRYRGWDTVVYAHPESMIYAHADEFEVKKRAVKSDFKYGDVVNARRLASHIREDNVRILSLHQSKDMFLGVLAKITARKFFKIIYSQHMHIGADKKDMFHAWEYGHFDAWITPVQWLADRVQEKTVVPKEKIHIIPRGIELDRFQDFKPDKLTARERLDLPPDAYIAGVIGRLDRKKCQDTAIRALGRLHENGHRVHLALIGDKTRHEETGYAEELRALVDERNLSDFVHFRPHQKEPEYAYASLDQFILPSESETAGMVVVEAFASGLPTIGTRAGGTISQLDHGRNGLLYEPHNDSELADCMTRFIADPSFAEEAAREALTDSRLKYSHFAQCEGWEQVIEGLVG